MPDVLVTGSGPSAMLAALDLAEVGLTVELVVAPGDVWPDRPERDPDGVIAAALARIAAPVSPGHSGFAGAEATSSPRTAPMLRAPGGTWSRQAEPEVLGIPAQPLAREVQRLLGGGGAFRAWLDRVTPVLTVGKTRALGKLVRARIGVTALSRLVEPAVVERYGVRADAVDTSVAAPGLNELLTRAGSLTGAALAYADRNVARETETAPTGGWLSARAALLERLSLYAVVLSDDAAVVAREGDAGWEIERASGALTHARGLVIDVGDRAAWSEGETPSETAAGPAIRVEDQAGAAHSALPSAAAERVHAEIGIQDPFAVVPSSDAREAGGLLLIELAGEPWSVRLSASAASASGWNAQLTGPRVGSDGGAVEAVELVRRLDTVLAESGVERAPGAEWRLRRDVAGFATAAERDGVDAELTAWRAEESERIAVGARLVGGDLARAFADADREATALRRRLTGISD
ncbi:hypothetical protein BMH32_11215 [Leucobacter sp. OLJS4]|uniref:hypothetical protein n=1 Tax=unclassified Leucobacter TaxID=2621730 RepID=UPI000C179265|nr:MULTISPECIES: hypothetical protein [unclassified Leucobacter]PII85060.1 hypothetical protein BMH25_02795 [Leucobacter sp. OLCALW19]PII89071.1 hypothetical protein BMH26_04400 [Leucobacter sp. OLTLW20]PII98082.1 hypothetical protein BMH29_09545 [Leucobacter sp. OLDS2]PIJ02623.1 hypothetical protein BMH28_04775 [Leucobacter sp. OLCS4]PIJ03742.1 hypothetical protein BMH31_06150 [Leucobacter sp. OLIS6]